MKFRVQLYFLPLDLNLRFDFVLLFFLLLAIIFDVAALTNFKVLT